MIGHSILLATGFVIAFLASLAALALSDTRLALPDALVDRVQSRIDARLGGIDIDLGRITVEIDRRGIPRVYLERVRLSSPTGADLASLSEIGVAISPAALLEGRIAPHVLRVGGADLILRRDRDGRFEISFGGGGSFTAETPGALLDLVEDAFDRPPLDRVVRVELRNAAIAVEDARTARVWQITNGSAVLTRDDEGLDFGLNADLFNGSDTLARLQLSIATDLDDSSAQLRAELDRVAASDIALQSPALAVLSVLNAPISGALRTTLAADGTLDGLAGTLQIGAGALSPRAEARPLSFGGARAYFDFDPATNRIAFSEVAVSAREGSARLSGHADLSEIGPNGFPRALLGQFSVDRLRITTPDLFPEPVEVRGGSVDLRLRLDPFTVEVGEWALPSDTGQPKDALRGTARATAGEDGWSADLSLRTQQMQATRLRQLWPVPVARKARAFFLERVEAGTIIDPVVSLRMRPDLPKPRTDISFGFTSASARVVPFLPLITEAAGFANLADGRFSLRLDEGRMTPAGRSPVNLSGTTFTIPETRLRPPPAEIDLVTEGPLASILALVDRPPLSVLSRSDRSPDIAQGTASGRTLIELPLKKGLTIEDVAFDVSGTITDFQSDSAVNGRSIRSTSVDVAVDKDEIRADGAFTFDGVPFRGAWIQNLSGPDRGKGSVEGTATVSDDSLAALGIALPDGLLSGTGTADIRVDLATGRSPRLTASSDLSGIGMAVDAVNWRLRPDQKGSFDLAATLGATPVVDRIRLDGPGLSARGSVRLSDGGGFGALTLDRVVLGDWLDASVQITARGTGQPPAIAVTSGSVDLRRAQLGGSGEGSGGDRGPVTLRLDRVTLTDTIALRDARVDLSAGSILSGSFSGLVNGGVAVAGALQGEAQGTAIRVQTHDAGALLRDAGLVDRVQGGQMEVILRPTGARGTYEGQARVLNPLLRDAPAVAELLSAISVVGLLEQLGTSGIPFEEVSAEFRVAPQRITLYRSSAVGASLGLSMDGVYDTVNKRMDMQGVVSPIYLLNRIGSIFTRRGEGLFGVNFTLQGPVSEPQVGVNPLSILTPGMFREIFRRPPPVRPTQ
ncbi:hypothetical protein [Palleronia abyssalis]|uniref:hypothetical protein n=1 Tax=Palleronia abyssalis TaxID=1501240 RepID=UPI000D559A3B|nr:hypothetical protein [Palleronia abyssalis]